MTTQTFFASSTMTSAPSLNTNDNTSLCNVLDACLINGFGSYTPPGWSILYSSTGQRVYQAPVGNRMPLYVNEGNSGIGSPYSPNGGAFVYAMETATGLGTGTNIFPSTSLYPYGFFIQKYSGQNFAGVPWWFFGNGSCFWFITASGLKSGTFGSGTATYNTIPYFFGDYISYPPGNSYGTCIGANYNGSSSASASYNFVANGVSPNSAGWNGLTNSTPFAADRTYDGGSLSPRVGFLAYAYSYLGNVYGTSATGIVDPKTTKAIMVQPHISLGGTQNQPIGKLPGMWTPITAATMTAGYNSGDTATDNVYDSSATFYFFGDGSYFNIAIEYDPNVAWS